MSVASVLGVADLPDGVLDALEEQYRTPIDRYYHTFDHAMNVALVAEKYPLWADRQAAILAALYHDAVYEPGNPENEFLSAALLHSHMRERCPPLTLYRAEKLIVLTAHHFTLSRYELNEDDCAFLDCDLAGLAAPWADFVEQNRNIDAEFLSIHSHDEVLSGRRKFLQGMLDRPRIFSSKFGHSRYEDLARANIKRALEELYPQE